MKPGPAEWRKGEANYGSIERVCKLAAPIFLDDLRNHKVLKTASFIRMNMQGRGLLASEYWPYLHSMIHKRNPKARKALARFGPEKI